MSEPYRIITVCSGNICRSPMAEEMLRQSLHEDNVRVDSAGIAPDAPGSGINPDAAQVLVEHDYQPAPGHHARQFQEADYADHDLILAMDTNHYRFLRSNAPDEAAREKVHLIREFDPTADGDLGIADPWYGGIEDFEETFDLLQKTLPGVTAYVSEHARR